MACQIKYESCCPISNHWLELALHLPIVQLHHHVSLSVSGDFGRLSTYKLHPITIWQKLSLEISLYLKYTEQYDVTFIYHQLFTFILFICIIPKSIQYKFRYLTYK